MKAISVFKKAFETEDISEKLLWEMEYKVKFIESNGGSIKDVADSDSRNTNIADSNIQIALQAIIGVPMYGNLIYKDFVEKMDTAKKLAFKK